MNYHDFPFIDFCLLFEDESKLYELGVSKEDWERVKSEYKDANPTQEEKILLESYKKALKANADVTRLVALLKFLLVTEVDWKDYFIESGLKYTGDLDKDSKYLRVQIEKNTTKNEVSTAQYKKLYDEISKAKEKNDAKPLSLNKVYKALATLEKMGASIPDPKKFTCGQYDAWSEIIKESSKNG